MNTHRGVGPIVSDGQITSEQRMSRIRTLRIFGGLHIGLGVICFILGVAGASLSAEDKNKECDNNYYTYYNSYAYYDAYTGYYYPGYSGYSGIYGNYKCKNEKSSSEASFIMFIVIAVFSGWVSEQVSLMIRNGYSIRYIGVGVTRWEKLCPLLRLCPSLITLLVSSNFSEHLNGIN